MPSPHPTGQVSTRSAARWWILVFTSIALFGNYYVYDSIAPVADLLQRQLGFSDTQLGTLNAIYSLPNIFMVLIGGVLVDRFGAARVTFWTGAICLLGAIATAISGDFRVMALGRLLFGIGAETMIVATLAAIGEWFAGRTVGLAMGLSISLARAGSYFADLSPTLAPSLYEAGWQPPLWLAAAIAAAAFAGCAAYWIIDARARRVPGTAPVGKASERIVWSDVWRFDRSYWYLVALCVLFYSVIFPFRSTFAIKYFQHAHALPLESAGLMNSYVFFAAIFATPLFGWMVDRFGHRAAFMTLGSLLLSASFVVLGATDWPLWVSTALIGISFSLIPAILWPAVSMLVEQRRLGTAFGLMTMLQNIGLTLCNVVVGRINDVNQAGADNPAGYLPMLAFFGLLALLGLVFAALLWRREGGPAGHGLERAAPLMAGGAAPAPAFERT
ncbi:MAG TPA: MFS transporter [Steroidobacteraceae bacterium]|nr:MFS transporter [Steroidobacteraceae bacterium]